MAKKYLDKDKLQEFATKLHAKQKSIFATKVEVGAPLVATTAADMTDTSKIYVYVGSEGGYTSGNWYYYNGSSWVSGGVYNAIAIQTDTTLSVANMAADAKAVGDVTGKLSTDTENAKNIIDSLCHEITITGIGGYFSYAEYQFKAGGKYEITNNSSGSISGGTRTDATSSGTSIETVTNNTDSGETYIFTATYDAPAIRLWFNGSGNVVIKDLGSKISKIDAKIAGIESDIADLESAIESDIADLESADADIIDEINANAETTEIIVQHSKNLLNLDDLTITGQWYANGSGHSSDALYKSFANRIEVEPSTDYVYSVNGETNVVMVTRVELDANGTLTAGGYNQPGTFTTQSTTKYLLVSIDASMATNNPQLEKGSTATEYEDYFDPYKTSGIRVDLDKLSTKVSGLYGKKICAFGDSLAAGDNGNRTANTWLNIVANYFGATSYNRGIGSSCVTNETSSGVARTGYAYVDSDGDAGQIRGLYLTSRTFDDYPNSISPWMCDSDRADTIPVDTDIVVIIAGTNDIGTVTLDSFKNAYRSMLDNIIDRVPDARIYPCTMPFQQTYDLGSDADKALYNSYRTAIKEISQEYGLEYIDLRSEMGVNAQNYATYMSDVTHYATVKGKTKMAECICSHLKNTCYCN